MITRLRVWWARLRRRCVHPSYGDAAPRQWKRYDHCPPRALTNDDPRTRMDVVPDLVPDRLKLRDRRGTASR